MRLIAIIVVCSLLALAVNAFAGRDERATGADRPTAVAIAWGGQVFTSRHAFNRWLRARGSSYKAWAHRHRALVVGHAQQAVPAQTAAKARRLHKHTAKKHRRRAANPQAAAQLPAPTNGTRRTQEFLAVTFALLLALFVRSRRRSSRSAATARSDSAQTASPRAPG